MNSVNIIGRATSNAILRHTSNGKPVTEFAIAHDDPYNRDPQTGKYRAYFFRCVVWGTKAEIAAQHITQGRRIGVTGRLTQEEYTPKGKEETRQSTRIVVDAFDLLELPRGHIAAENQSSRPPTTTPDQEEQIPF